MLKSPAGRRLGVALLTLTFIGCTDPLGPASDELALARARWTMTNADNYVFEFQRSCFCATDSVRPIRIEILDGLVSSASYTDTEEPISPPFALVPTIDDLFDEVQGAVDGMASSVIANFDAEMGYPTSVQIDYIRDAIDDEVSFTVSSFQLLDVSGT